MPRPGTAQFTFYPDEETRKILDEQENRSAFINAAIKAHAGKADDVLSDEQMKKFAKRLAAELKKLENH